MASQIRSMPQGIQDEIGELRVLIAEMGGRAEHAIAGAVAALTRGDEAGAKQIVADDAVVDSMAAKVERLAVAIIGQGVLQESDLRDVVAALKMAGVVERIADYAKNIAKRVPQIRNDRKIEAVSVLPAMAEAAMAMVRDALDAFAARDPAKAVAVTRRDRQVDDFYDAIFRALVTHMMENPPTIGAAAQLLFVAKNLERIGDHATNIAEMVYFAATGDQMAERERGAGEIG
ncbi:MAG TPA: phosphate signaling complex protein PhoU [Sphingomonas sp.]|nr:phosphate signaling complex protein PhoU [Sphingomonas sp.]